MWLTFNYVIGHLCQKSQAKYIDLVVEGELSTAMRDGKSAESHVVQSLGHQQPTK